RFVKRIAPRAAPSAKPAGAVTIGRASDNDIVVPDVLASRYHATLTLTPLGTEIRDTSVNGTFVNGTRVGSAILSEDDVVIAGYTTPSSGSVTFEGHDIHAEYASLRSRIGMVPQDDVVHRQLTVNQALSYAAELRLPPDTSKADRTKIVSQVLEELDLTKHA